MPFGDSGVLAQTTDKSQEKRKGLEEKGPQNDEAIMGMVKSDGPAQTRTFIGRRKKCETWCRRPSAVKKKMCAVFYGKGWF